jgi:hypothetical protein
MTGAQYVTPDHIRCGGALYYLTWPRMISVTALILIAIFIVTAATEYSLALPDPQYMPQQGMLRMAYNWYFSMVFDSGLQSRLSQGRRRNGKLRSN